ncbi:YceI-like domain protein [Pirellula sp. SH-Sr6A]|uniref:YceI family protein n=1 Tax=Pirellula sp. SH-Sr6A TaxID=1632865 RepID=UPI00078E049D|nr:YceI family protein [Pirellula sp. SH-Sr6A]AMV33805.1 YceI-like domain protein [Pirellula sp. SH-Sr6A]
MRANLLFANTCKQIAWLKESLTQKRSVLACKITMSVLLLLGWFVSHATAQNGTEKNWVAGEINTEFSRVFIFVDKAGLVGHQHAVEGRLKDGHLVINDDKKSSITFDMKSFDADTPLARKYLSIQSEIDEETRKKVNENMLGLEILSVEHYPEATLKNVKWKPTGKTSKRNLPEYLLEGNFTLHKTTRPIQAVCDAELKDGWLHVRGAFRILQSDYRIKPFSKMMGTVGVKDELRIYGDLWVVPAS